MILPLPFYSFKVMNRNIESHFSELPKIDIQRSIFDRSSSHKTSFNVGELIPFFVDECLPGDSFKITTSAVVRLQTPLTPIMDNIYMDTYYFFVPNRILWNHWKEFMGENTSSAWIPQTTYTIPKTTPPSGGWNVGTIADYMGIPPGVGPGTIPSFLAPSNLPFRAYAMIADQWFRDQNVSAPVLLNLGDSNTAGSNGSSYITDLQAGGKPFMVAKYHDYFTSCLPTPQKGNDVMLLSNRRWTSIGLLTNNAYAPVVTRNEKVFGTYSSDIKPLRLVQQTTNTGFYLQTDSDDKSVVFQNSGGKNIVPCNLWADLSGSNISINDLRIAFQLQKFYEKNARAGTRYREILKEHFGVSSSDARMQIPEYLGGHRFPLSIHQVANSAASSGEFLGDLGAMSNTSDVHEDFTRSFEEHGFVIGVCCVRYDHSYPQGLERFWKRITNLDYYYPVFANIGEQPVYKSEIYWNPPADTDSVFGYQEAWADYRYKPNRVSGEMRPGIANSLATWHLSDYYTQAPTLSDSWIREDMNTVDRVLSVGHSVSNQVFCDFYVKNIATRPMPMYSIPGLIDHH